MADTQGFKTQFTAGEVWEQQVDGVVLRGRWIEHSDPNAPVVHFVHGNGFACDMYAPALSPIVEKASLFTHDMEGHGLSDCGEEFVGFEQTSQRIGAVLAKQGARFGRRKRIAVGHSFGAITTLRYVSQNPEFFDAMILLDPVLFSEEQTLAAQQQYDAGQASSPLAEQALQRGSHWDSYDDAFEYFNGRKSLAGWHPAGLVAYLNGVLRENPDGSCSLRCPPWMEAEIFAQRPNNHWTSIKALATPALAIYGQQSLPFIAPNLKQAAKMNSCISVVGTAGGHCFTQEYPESLSDIVSGYPPVAEMLNSGASVY